MKRPLLAAATLLSIGTDQLFGYLQKTLTPRGLKPA